MEDMNFYNKHYISIRKDGCIVNGFSDAFRQPSETDILLTDEGGYQFRLHYLVYDPTYELTWHHRVSEENPALYDWNGMIPLYKYEGGFVKRRTEEEIEADREVLMQPTEAEVRARRDKLLAETDWTQVLDAPISAESRDAFRVYRQALRDITEQEGFPAAVVWPELPAVGKAAPDPVDTAVDILLGGDE